MTVLKMPTKYQENTKNIVKEIPNTDLVLVFLVYQIIGYRLTSLHLFPAKCRQSAVRVWNGLDQSAGFIIQSSPDGFGLDWIRNSPTQRILDWTGSRNVQCIFHV